ncbi:hypothetical protein P4H71_18685 [Paenibacillus kribbensis]|uniref:hypothetical protein n=1 Tax=Paenibacillus TaxID=44249 RepID=UPI00024F0153|nr:MULTISPECIES: hypothetical protein [Paenibacillus]EHS57492.1 hypothetical protein WG8_2448 [Paenibacillus sp. Aloe-11]MEC0236352.1 hypothetical protein [Paenibacillus kribbensis]
MFAKIVLLFLLFMAMLTNDIPKLKRTSRRDWLAYGALMMPMIYLSFIFVMEKPWPNFNDILVYFFSAPAKRIVEALRLPS